MPERVHRFVIAVAVWEWIAVATGAFQSSSRIALNVQQLGTVHAILGVGVLLALLALAAWGRLVRGALWLSFASLALSAGSGWISPVWHAVLSHSAIAMITAATVLTSAAWSQPVKPMSTGAWKALRPAALLTPPVVLVQIAMGALYRHQILGVMPHMLGAMVVAILALVVAMILIQHFGDQSQLKRPASALLAVVLAQVCLGIAAFLMLLLGADKTPAFLWLTTSHVCVGSLTLAASVVAAMQVHRYLVADSAR